MSLSIEIIPLFLAIGVGKLAADLTPDLRGPGYIAFALTMLAWAGVARLVHRRRR